MTSKRATLLSLAFCLLVSSPLFAITRTWTGAVSANWSDPANWSPAGVPGPSDTLVLGKNNSQNRDMINDLPAWTRIGPISMPNLTSFSLSGNPMILTGTVSGECVAAWNVDLRMEADVTLPGYVFNGTIDLNGHAVTLHTWLTRQFNSPPADINGAIVGTGTLIISGIRSRITSSNSFSGTVRIDSSCELVGSMANADFDVDQGELTGGGTVRSLSGIGDINPGSLGATFRTFSTSSLSLDGAYIADVAFNTTTRSDTLDVTGTVRLSGTLYPVLGLQLTPPTLGREVVLIENDGNDPVIGTFLGRPEGALIPADGLTMRISYHGGDGNDVTLTSVAYQKQWTGACGSNWSAPCNWSPAAVPLPGEPLDFGGHPLRGTYPNNDLTAGLVLGGLTLNGYILEGNPITLTGDVSAGPLGGDLYLPVTIGSSLHIRNCQSFRRIDVNGQTLSIDGPTIIYELNGSGTIPPGMLSIDRGTFAGVLSGSIAIGALRYTSITGATHLGGFRSDTEVADIAIDAGGTIEPGLIDSLTSPPAPVGTISATSLLLDGTYDCDLFANTADRIIISGPISLSGNLNVVIRKSGQTAASFMIIDNRGSAPVSGTFIGLPEGALLQAGGLTFKISYQGGDGNDVVLIRQTATTIALAQSADATAFGEPFTFTATVTGSEAVVTFSDGLVSLGNVSPSNGVAALSLASLPTGSHTITAVYGSTTASVTHTVQRGTTRLVVLTGNTAAGQSPSVTAIVAAEAPAEGTPTGLVTAEIDGIGVSTARLDHGAWTFSAGAVAAGRHTVTVHYDGDENFESCVGSTELVIVPPRGRSVRH